MKKYILTLLIALLTCSISLAQTQQGIVKTRGRMVNGKVEPGKRLSGATITLNLGNSLVSNGQGTFSFNVPAGKSFSLVSAKKHGYTLADPEYTRRSFTYSAKNPFYVVLEDEAQRQADINAATRKVRKTLTAQLEKREDEIEELKRQNKLTEKEYQKRLQELYDNQSKSEQLVKEMAERYASTDYDQLDDFNRQIQMYIEEGELQKADSMIRNKGDIEQRVAEYHNVVEANKQEREKLEKSEAATAKTYEDLSQDLFNKHTIALQQYDWDEALKYLKQRADLDTTIIAPAWDYASLCFQQKKYTDCEKYGDICLNAFTLYNDLPAIANCQMNLGNLYFSLHEYYKSLKFFEQALENYETLFESDPEAYRVFLAQSQSNMGTWYNTFHDTNNAEHYYTMASKNYEELCKESPNAYRYDLSIIHMNLGQLYLDLLDYDRSKTYSEQAYETILDLFSQNPNAYRSVLADIQDNLGSLYSYTQDFDNGEKFFCESLKNREILFSHNPSQYRDKLAQSQYNIALFYCNFFKYDDSEKYLKLAQENLEILYNKYHNTYILDLSRVYVNMIMLYEAMNKEKAYEEYLRKTIPIITEIGNFDMCIELRNKLIAHLLERNCVDEALTWALETYSMDKSNEESKFNLAYSYAGLAEKCRVSLDIDNAVNYIDEALALIPDDVILYDIKGAVLLQQGKNEEALAIWQKILELYPNFLTVFPEGTNLSNGLKKLGLIE